MGIIPKVRNTIREKQIRSSIKDPKKKDLASATLNSIALNYITKKGPNPPKALQRALKQQP